MYRATMNMTTFKRGGVNTVYLRAVKQMYIIAGCNGAGKTTASYTVLPEMLDCKEFVNADEIAKGISPFQADKASLQAGRLMLTRIRQLLEKGEDFAFETTLSTRSYVSLVKQSQSSGYFVSLLFFWLDSPDLAVSRVKNRVLEGGHDIPETVVRRRYTNGLSNLFKLYIHLVDNWVLVDNSGEPYQEIAEGAKDNTRIVNQKIWKYLIDHYGQ